MDLNSPLFDRIRLGRADDDRSEGPACDHPGCRGLGPYRAPQGRGREGKYFNFCLEHVREYNRTYDYFAGMSDDAVMQYQKAASIGHRPTWAMGVNAAGRARADRRSSGQGSEHASAGSGADRPIDDPLGLFGHRFARARSAEEARPRVGPVALKALETLGLDEGVDAAAVKARYKSLVKRYHPDANGGDRSYETRLQEIIRAYATLKAAGLG